MNFLDVKAFLCEILRREKSISVLRATIASPSYIYVINNRAAARIIRIWLTQYDITIIDIPMIVQTKSAAEYSHRALAEAHRGIRIEFFGNNAREEEDRRNKKSFVVLLARGGHHTLKLKVWRSLTSRPK